MINNEEKKDPVLNLRQVLALDIKLPLYHDKHKSRHPLAIYNVSSSTVLGNFKKTIDELYQVLAKKDFTYANRSNWDNDLLALQKELLYSMMEYLDDCDNILLCFFPSKKLRNGSDVNKRYKKATKKYRDFIGKTVNYLKHNQGRLRSIVFYNDEVVLPGYFVEGPIGDNFIGAAEVVHAKGNTAFSFYRDLRYQFVHFYLVGMFLGNAIKEIITLDGAIEESFVIDDIAIEIASLISKLPLFFYTDEKVMPIPNIKKNQSYFFQVIYPDDSVEIQTVLPKMKIRASSQGDGVTRSFRPPYWK